MEHLNEVRSLGMADCGLHRRVWIEAVAVGTGLVRIADGACGLLPCKHTSHPMCVGQSRPRGTKRCRFGWQP
eukprot:10769297-Alexandrium_andersonii.AAC.1